MFLCFASLSDLSNQRECLQEESTFGWLWVCRVHVGSFLRCIYQV